MDEMIEKLNDVADLMFSLYEDESDKESKKVRKQQFDTVIDVMQTIQHQQAEIERLKAQKQKWLRNIADQQLAVSPTGYETEEGLAKRTGEWNGLQMAWEILTEGR